MIEPVSWHEVQPIHARCAPTVHNFSFCAPRARLSPLSRSGSLLNHWEVTALWEALLGTQPAGLVVDAGMK